MIEKYFNWLDTQSEGVQFAGIFVPVLLGISLFVGIMVGLGVIFGWFGTDSTTHLHGQCEQFFQYVQVGHTLILEPVNVCP